MCGGVSTGWSEEPVNRLEPVQACSSPGGRGTVGFSPGEKEDRVLQGAAKP